MPPPFIETHYSVFDKIPYEAQSVLGCIPSCWANKFQLKDVPDFAALPVVQLDRRAVRAICQSSAHPVLFGYVCAMAWGLQGKDRKTEEHVGNAWNERKAIKRALKKLRSGGLNRADAYDLFCGKYEVKYLGPSYFTKLLYFFSPTPDFYIMDKWTSKSVNLLTEKEIVKMNGSPTRKNTGKNYQKFCEVVDSLAWQLGNTGEQIEERLFSKDGRPPAQWRAYVNEHYRHKKSKH